jgi:dGTPase
MVGQELIERHNLTDFSLHDFGAIVGAAALCHDIGNPPFGHSGEEAISEFYRHGKGYGYLSSLSDSEEQDLRNFEGNAQGFRLLNKKRYQGLQLTSATLAAFTKYPRPSLFEDRDKARRSQKKFGYYQAESERFAEVAVATGMVPSSTGAWLRHPLAFLVEAADDICYHLIDLEDGCRLRLVSYEQTVELYRMILRNRFNAEKLAQIPSQEERIGTLRALAIGVLIEECSALFLEQESSILTGEFDVALTDVIPSAEVLGEIIRISVDRIYRSPEVVETEVAGFEVLPGLLEKICDSAVECYRSDNATTGRKAILRLLPADINREMINAENLYELLMLCNDFVSGLTDSHAIHLYRKIKGISLPG